MKLRPWFWLAAAILGISLTVWIVVSHHGLAVSQPPQAVAVQSPPAPISPTAPDSAPLPAAPPPGSRESATWRTLPPENATPPWPPNLRTGAATLPAAGLPPKPVPPPAREATASASRDLDAGVPSVELQAVSHMLRDFRSIAGENPTGTNAEIMKSVMGANKKGARLGPPEGQPLNAAGELVDQWGTPYFFHQLSRLDMEIRSAGPDQQMWTNDDQVTH